MTDKMNLKIEYIQKEKLKPYAKNAKTHPAEQVEQIKKSIQEFGFNDPIAVWGKNEIVEGHGRLLAVMELDDVKTVPVIRLDNLTDEQRRAYMLAHNKLTMNSPFELDILQAELDDITDIDMSLFGFDFEHDGGWFESRERFDSRHEEGNEEYNEFIDKFEPKKTTDDCYTPDIVYDAIADWVANEYKLKRDDFIRPFFPGGDYQKNKYPEGCVVVDNPPFSILAEIIRWYSDHGIRFFLFAPSLTLFSSSSSSSVACSLPCGGKITYENGAIVPTSFVTNLEDNRVRVVPDLYKVIKAADEKNQAQFKKTLPKYKYPDEVLTAAMCRYMAEHETPLTIRKEDSYHIRQLESQKEYDGSAIFGSGYLLSEKAAAEKAAAEKAASEKAAAEKAAAEKAAAKVWELSEEERAIVRSLGKKGDG